MRKPNGKSSKLRPDLPEFVILAIQCSLYWDVNFRAEQGRQMLQESGLREEAASNKFTEARTGTCSREVTQIGDPRRWSDTIGTSVPYLEVDCSM